MWEMPNTSVSLWESVLSLIPTVLFLKYMWLPCSGLELGVHCIEVEFEFSNVDYGSLILNPALLSRWPLPVAPHCCLLKLLSPGYIWPFLNYILLCPLFPSSWNTLEPLFVWQFSPSHSNAPPHCDPFRSSNTEMIVLFFQHFWHFVSIFVMKYNTFYNHPQELLAPHWDYIWETRTRPGT